MKNLFKIVILIIAIIPSQLCAQDQPGIKDSLYSDVLKEYRTIYVNLPENYETDSGTQWDVIYVTDGEWNTESTTFIHSFARFENFFPHAIIIGIPNTYIGGENQRDRDFLPVHMEHFPLSGKADNFLEFFKSDLIPFVDGKYTANENRTLLGHSFGGVFTMYALLSQPDLFENYIATDPPFHWNNDFVNKMAAENLSSLENRDKVSWISGIETTAKIMGIGRMDSILQKHAPAGLHWKLVNFPNETHNSVRLKGIYDGLKFAYDGYNKGSFDFHPMKGIVLKDKPFNIWLDADPTNLYYTIDGSEPTTSSSQMESLISLNGPTVLKVKSISNRGNGINP